MTPSRSCVYFFSPVTSQHNCAAAGFLPSCRRLLFRQQSVQLTAPHESRTAFLLLSAFPSQWSWKRRNQQQQQQQSARHPQWWHRLEEERSDIKEPGRKGRHLIRDTVYLLKREKIRCALKGWTNIFGLLVIELHLLLLPVFVLLLATYLICSNTLLFSFLFYFLFLF